MRYFLPTQADLQTQVEVTGVITQGRHYTDQWLKQYTVSYSLDCSYWLPIIGPGGSEQVGKSRSILQTQLH